MANVNYVNPNGMDPRGEWTPQHFMAGWNYQDRLNDYNTARDLSNESSRLANMNLQAQNEDFAAAAPFRAAERADKMRVFQNQAELNPYMQQTAMSNARVDANVATNSEGIRAATLMAQLTNALDDAKRKKAIDDTMTLSRLTKGYSGTQADPQVAWPMILQQANRMGVDTKDFKSLDAAQAMQFFTVMDDTWFKEQSANIRQTAKGKMDYVQAEMEQNHADYRAGLQSGKQSASGQKEANLQAWTDKFVTLREKDLLHRQNPNKNPPLSAREQAEMEAAQIRVRDAFYQQGAAIQKEAAGTSNSLGILSGEEPSVPTTAPAKSAAQTRPKDGKQWNVDNGDDYDSIPSGTTYMMDGQLWNKK